MASRNTIFVNRSLYQLAVLTLVSSIIWVGVNIYLSINKPLDVGVENTITTPIDASYDKETVNQLLNRIKIEGELETTQSSDIVE